MALYTLSDFGAVSLLRYETFTWAIFLQYDSALDRTLAATMSLALVAIALGLVAAEALTRGRARYFRSDPGATGPGSRVRLGRWTWQQTIWDQVRYQRYKINNPVKFLSFFNFL